MLISYHAVALQNWFSKHEKMLFFFSFHGKYEEIRPDIHPDHFHSISVQSHLYCSKNLSIKKKKNVPYIWIWQDTNLYIMHLFILNIYCISIKIQWYISWSNKIFIIYFLGNYIRKVKIPFFFSAYWGMGYVVIFGSWSGIKCILFRRTVIEVFIAPLFYSSPELCIFISFMKKCRNQKSGTDLP